MLSFSYKAEMPPAKLTYTSHLSEEAKLEVGEIFLRIIEGVARKKDPKIELLKREYLLLDEIHEACNAGAGKTIRCAPEHSAHTENQSVFSTEWGPVASPSP